MTAWEVLECERFGDIRLIGMYVLVSFNHMCLVNETETMTCHTLVLPVRPRPRFIAPWSHNQALKQDWEQDSLEYETKTENNIPAVS